LCIDPHASEDTLPHRGKFQRLRKSIWADEQVDGAFGFVHLVSMARCSQPRACYLHHQISKEVDAYMSIQKQVDTHMPIQIHSSAVPGCKHLGVPRKEDIQKNWKSEKSWMVRALQ
jgi:hypothetical protein